MRTQDDSSDESSDSSFTEMVSFAGVISSVSVASSEEVHDETSGMDGLDIACRRVRFAQEALQHGHGKRHNMVKERLGISISEDFHDDSGSRSPPLRSGPPAIAGIYFMCNTCDQQKLTKAANLPGVDGDSSGDESGLADKPEDPEDLTSTEPACQVRSPLHDNSAVRPSPRGPSTLTCR
jgi:hypothetical protein